MYVGLHVTYSLFLSDLNDTSVVSTDFRKILISDFMKIRPVGSDLFHTDRRMDRHDEGNSRFSRFSERA
jgi:hypothetical protein